VTEDVLKIELRLLLLRYGRRRVLNTLAVLGDQTPEDLDAALTLMEGREVKRTRKIVPAPELAVQFASERPEVAKLIQTLATRYENRTFLPELREVQRFLDRAGERHRRLRSRSDGAREVIKILSQLSVEDLNRLVVSKTHQDDDDFRLLAKEIMGKPVTERDPKGSR